MPRYPEPSAQYVAAFIIKEQHAVGRSVDKLQLQKLLYLVQGAHFAMWGRRAFRETITAFKNGPVVKNVEYTYRQQEPNQNNIRWALADAERVPDPVRDTVKMVLGYFGTWSGPDLESFTKQDGSPWVETRGRLPLYDNSDIEIDDALIINWFRTHSIQPDAPSGASDDALARVANGDPKALAELLA